jgi:hypothetical protein
MPAVHGSPIDFTFFFFDVLPFAMPQGRLCDAQYDVGYIAPRTHDISFHFACLLGGVDDVSTQIPMFPG